MIFLEEDPGDATSLNLDMLDKALPDGLRTDGAITSNWTGFPIIQENNLSVGLQRQSQRTIFTSPDVRPNLHLPRIVCIERKDHTTDTQFWTFEVLNKQKQVACQFKEMQSQCRMSFIREETPERADTRGIRPRQFRHHQVNISRRIERICINTKMILASGIVQPTLTSITRTLFLLIELWKS